MPYEYFLEPLEGTEDFAPNVIAQMRSFVETLPSLKTHPNDYYLFTTNEERDARRAEVLRESSRWYELLPSIHFSDPRTVTLCCVIEPKRDTHLRTFVVWCQERWPCRLHEYG